MTEIIVDDSLVFSFHTGWKGMNWGTSAERAALTRRQRHDVDIVGVGAWALLVEVKDDRVMEARPRERRRRSVKSEAFFALIAAKVHDTLADIDEVEGASSHPVLGPFRSKWPGRVFLWWELPPHPPSGEGTPDQRWKARLATYQDSLQAALAEKLSATIRVAVINQRFGADKLPAKVRDHRPGVAKRRGRTVTPASGPSFDRPRKKASKRLRLRR